jgi:hypothetical protein
MTSHTDIVANKNDKIPWYVYFVGGVIVVDGAAKISVMFHDGTRVPAELIGSDRETDRALLHVVLPKGPHNHAQLGDSDKLEVGQKVLAIGHPFGLAYALANVVISGLGKLAETNQDVSHERIIQTTAPINPGNSGGPLMDSADQVIGINTVILMDAENIAFVIPINTVKSIVTALQGSSRVIRPWLDVKGKFVTEELRNLMALPLFSGLLIMDVDDGSPAEKIGLQAGQLSVTIEGEPWVLGVDILTVQWANGDEYGTIYESVAGASIRSMIEMPVFKDGVSCYERQARGTSNGAQTTTPPQNPGASVCPARFYARRLLTLTRRALRQAERAQRSNDRKQGSPNVSPFDNGRASILGCMTVAGYHAKNRCPPLQQSSDYMEASPCRHHPADGVNSPQDDDVPHGANVFAGCKTVE